MRGWTRGKQEIQMNLETNNISSDYTYVPQSSKGVCPNCGKEMLKHIVEDGARIHMLSWSTLGTHCSEPDCEANHSPGVCMPLTEDK